MLILGVDTTRDRLVAVLSDENLELALKELEG